MKPKGKLTMKHRNPILPIPICIPDAEARVCQDGTVYLYGSRDLYADSFCSDLYCSVHSRDLSECLGRCWLDTRENPFLRLEEGGEAVWRYLELTDEFICLQAEGRGNAPLEIRIDGHPAGQARPGEKCEIKTTAGLHTLSVRSSRLYELERIRTG